MFELLKSGDVKVFYLVYKGMKNTAFDAIMPFVTDLASHQSVFIIGLLTLFIARRQRMAGLLILAGSAATSQIGYMLKLLFGRARPFVALHDVVKLVEASGPSFPSSHSIKAFMAATILSCFFKKGTPLFFLLACAVGFSRVYLGVHYPLDVALGAVVGCAVGYGLVFLYRKWSCRSNEGGRP